MKLVSFSYNNEVGKLEGLNLQSVNLIVGRNASGKSQTLYHIEGITDLLSEKKNYAWKGNWQIEFETENNKSLSYSFERDHEIIINEKLVLDDIILIDREASSCTVYSTASSQREKLTPPKDKLVIHVRRDTDAYPYFENIIEWASESYHFRFGAIVSYLLLPTRRMTDAILSTFNKNGESLSDLFDGLTRTRQEDIITVMNDMGYSMSEYGTRPDSEGGRLFVYKENINEEFLSEYFLSQGTLRILILLTYLNYLLQHRGPVLVCIDDLGEGLDYQRSIKLGKYIYHLCEESNIQLIATSNDGFVMDSVPIEYWNVLRRNGSKVIALNEKNQPELFDRFAYTGLSNFDFFSSDYIDSRLK